LTIRGDCRGARVDHRRFLRVERGELPTRIGDQEAPLDLDPEPVPLGIPGLDLVGQHLPTGDLPPRALPGRDARLHLHRVRRAGVLRRAAELMLLAAA
jgi:hypothetical protein